MHTTHQGTTAFAARQGMTTGGADASRANRSVLATLRSLIPRRPLSFDETLQITERQATKLLELHNATDAPVLSEIISELPRIRVVLDPDMPVSGSSGWDGTTWVISLNKSEPWARRRFTLAHEYLHIIHHGYALYLYSANPGEAAIQAEQATDYFAGCLLVPKRLLKRVWCTQTQDVSRLARHFGVSPAAIRYRLVQTGLISPTRRCNTRPNRYAGQSSPRRAGTRYHDHPARVGEGGRG